MGFVGRIKQTATVPELRSQTAAVTSAQSVFDAKLVCEATAWTCDLWSGLRESSGPALAGLVFRRNFAYGQRIALR